MARKPSPKENALNRGRARQLARKADRRGTMSPKVEAPTNKGSVAKRANSSPATSSGSGGSGGNKPPSTRVNSGSASGGKGGPKLLSEQWNSARKLEDVAKRKGISFAKIKSLAKKAAGPAAFMALVTAYVTEQAGFLKEEGTATTSNKLSKDPRSAKNARVAAGAAAARAKARANGASPKEANKAAAAYKAKRKAVDKKPAREVTANKPKEVKANKPNETKAAASSAKPDVRPAPVPRKRPSKGTTAKELYNLGKDEEKKAEVKKKITKAKKKSRIVQDYNYPGDKY